MVSSNLGPLANQPERHVSIFDFVMFDPVQGSAVDRLFGPREVLEGSLGNKKIPSPHGPPWP